MDCLELITKSLSVILEALSKELQSAQEEGIGHLGLKFNTLNEIAASGGKTIAAGNSVEVMSVIEETHEAPKFSECQVSLGRGTEMQPTSFCTHNKTCDVDSKQHSVNNAGNESSDLLIKKCHCLNQQQKDIDEMSIQETSLPTTGHVAHDASQLLEGRLQPTFEGVVGTQWELKCLSSAAEMLLLKEFEPSEMEGSVQQCIDHSKMEENVQQCIDHSKMEENVQQCIDHSKMEENVQQCIDHSKMEGSVQQCIDHSKMEESILQCNAVLDSVWQRLHTGHWSEIPDGYRRLYTIASVVLCGLLLQKFKFKLTSRADGDVMKRSCRDFRTFKKFKGEEDSLWESFIKTSASTIVQVCDRGLLMGNPMDANPLPKVASFLNGPARGSAHLPTTKLKGGPPSAIEQVEYNCNSSQRSSLVLFDLGWLRKPSLTTFLLRHVQTKSPIKLLGVVDEWPALAKWNFPYLCHIAGARTVPVEIGSQYTDSDWSQTLLTLDEYVAKYVDEEENLPCGYLAQHQLFNQIPELLDDLTVPDYCHLGVREPTLNAWIGPKGTVTPLHQDPDHNILVQVCGCKYVILYPEDQTDFVYPYCDDLLHNTSQVNFESPHILGNWPLLEKAKGFEVKLCPGEALYIPPKCWHFVKSLSKSISVSFWWK